MCQFDLKFSPIFKWRTLATGLVYRDTLSFASDCKTQLCKRPELADSDADLGFQQQSSLTGSLYYTFAVSLINARLQSSVKDSVLVKGT
jgi:hypothetical protein